MVPAAPLATTLPFPCSHLQARVRVLVDGSLLLQQTTPDDAGKYTCIPSNGLWKPPSASAFITVLCKPRCPLQAQATLAPAPIMEGPCWASPGGSPKAMVGRGCPFSCNGDPSPLPPSRRPPHPVCPRRSGAGDHHAPRNPPAQGDAGCDPLPHQGQSPSALRQLDEGRAPTGAGQGTAARALPCLPAAPSPSS